MLRKHISIWILLFSCSALYAQIIDTVCAGTTQTYAVDSSKGSTYAWTVTGGSIVDGDGTHKIVVTWAKQPGLFKISVTEHNTIGCTGQPQSGNIWIRGPLFTTKFPDKACVNDSVTLIALGGYKYLWSNGQTDSIIRIKLTHDTLMNVTISDTVCGFSSESFDASIKASSKPVMSIVTEENSVLKNQRVNIFYNGDIRDKINWSIEKSNQNSPTGHNINVQFIDTGEALIKVVSMNALGCKDSAFTKINVLAEQLFFPNAFTPNGDGLNDVFKPHGSGVEQYQLIIYNRWGQVMFETSDFTLGWDGTQSQNPVQSDVYVYQCEMTGISGKRYNYSGNITVVR